MTPILVKPIFLTRYTLFLMPFLYLIIAFGISEFEKPFKTILILILILLFTYTLLVYYPETTKEDWRSAADYIEQNPYNGTIVLTCWGDLAFSYYYRGNAKIISPFEIDVSELMERINNKSIWVVHSPEHSFREVCKKAIYNRQSLVNKSFTGVDINYYK